MIKRPIHIDVDVFDIPTIRVWRTKVKQFDYLIDGRRIYCNVCYLCSKRRKLKHIVKENVKLVLSENKK
jgi:hypothetical protein